MTSLHRPAKKLVIYCDSAAATVQRTWKVKLGIEDPETKEIKYINDKDRDHFDLVDPWDLPRYEREMTPEISSSKSRVGSCRMLVWRVKRFPTEVQSETRG